MEKLRIYCKLTLGTSHVEKEVECDVEHMSQKNKIELIKVVLNERMNLKEE